MIDCVWCLRCGLVWFIGRIIAGRVRSVIVHQTAFVLMIWFLVTLDTRQTLIAIDGIHIVDGFFIGVHVTAAAKKRQYGAKAGYPWGGIA